MNKENDEKIVPFLIRIPEELHTELKIDSIKKKKTIRDCIIEAIKNYLKD